MEIMQVQADEFVISTDRDRLDVPLIHSFLCNDSYWAKGIPRSTVERSLQHSLCFGIYRADQQTGFARVITDYTTFAYLADVFIVPAYRGRGLSKWLVKTILGHPELQGLRRWMLATTDAHGLYKQFGFVPLPHPERFLQLHYPDVYKQHP